MLRGLNRGPVDAVAALTQSRRVWIEALTLALLASAIVLAFGNLRHEAVTVVALKARSTALPERTARLLLDQGVRQAHDPSLAPSPATRRFRVDVLRDHRLKLVCQAESSLLAQELCNGAALATIESAPELKLVERAQESSLALQSLLAAVWPALLIGLGWFVLRS